MLTLKCTKKVQDLLRLRQDDLAEPEEGPDNSPLGAWYVNEIRIDRRKCLIFMSERSLLSFVLFGVRKSNTSKELLPDMCLEGVFQLLKMEDCPLKLLNTFMASCVESKFTKTNSKKVLGNLNELAATYEHMIWHEGGFENCDLNNIFTRVNRTPQRNLGWNYSIDVAKELLSAYAA